MALTPSFEWTRAQWRGRRDSNPPLAQRQVADWWYRTDLGLFCYWDGSTVLCWGGTGGSFYTEAGNFTIPIGGGCIGGLITVSDVDVISFVVSLTVTGTAPSVCDVYTPQRISVIGNVIGITIGSVTGTTITLEALVSGYDL